MFILLSIILLWLLLGLLALCVCILFDKKRWISKWWMETDSTDCNVISTGSDVLYTIVMGPLPFFLYVFPNLVMYCIVERSSKSKPKSNSSNVDNKSETEQTRGNN